MVPLLIWYVAAAQWPCTLLLTWNWEEGEDSQRNDTEFCKGKVDSNDVYQNLLRDVGGPEHDKTELQGRQDNSEPGCKERV